MVDLLHHLNPFLIRDRDAELALVRRVDHGVRPDLAVRELIDEALAGRSVHPDTKHRGGALREVERDPHAFFIRAVPGTALNPIRLNDLAADAVRLTPAFACRARLIRGLELIGEFRILMHAVGDIRAETAVAENDAFLRADVFHGTCSPHGL